MEKSYGDQFNQIPSHAKTIPRVNHKASQMWTKGNKITGEKNPAYEGEPIFINPLFGYHNVIDMFLFRLSNLFTHG